MDCLLGLPNTRVFFVVVVFWLTFPTHPSCKQILRQAGPRFRVSQKTEKGMIEEDSKSPEGVGKGVCLLSKCPGSQASFLGQNLGHRLKYWKKFFK